MSAYRKDFRGTKYTYFLRKNDELFETYNEIGEKASNSVKKEFNNEPIY